MYAVCRRYRAVHVERKLEEWRRATVERELKISRRKTGYLEGGGNEHQDAEIQLQGETVKRVKTCTYLGSTLVDDGELDAEVTHRVQSGWKNWKRVSGLWSDRRMNVKINGKVCVQNSGKTSTDVRGRDMGVEEGTGKEIGGRRNENATMDVRSYEDQK